MTLPSINPLNSRYVNALDYGAVGDGVHDDTAAIQSAINDSIAQFRPLYVPTGEYYLSAGLVVSTPTGTVRGWQMIGEGDGCDAGAGTRFKYYGGPIKAILTVSTWRGAHFADFSVVSATQGAVQYGILIPDNTPSCLRFERISVWNVSRAFGQEYVSGENGEFYHFHSCKAQYVDEFWHNDAGQGYVHSFVNCVCFLNPGGIYFNLNLSASGGGGGGVNVFDFNGTGFVATGGTTSNSTLVRADYTNSVINFIGGRVEWLTRLIERTPTSENMRATPLFKGMQFTVSNPPTPDNTKQSFIYVNSGYDIVSIEQCKLQSIAGTDLINYAPGSNSWSALIDWRNCCFEKFATDPTLNLPPNVKFNGCLYSGPSGGQSQLRDGIGSFTQPP